METLDPQPYVAPVNEFESEEHSEENMEEYELFNYNEAILKLKKCIDDFSDEIKCSEIRRKMRKLDVDTDTLRQENKLKADETFIPIRVIDTNIKQEEPVTIAYVTQSRRLVIFEPLNIPRGTIDTQDLEMDFTKLMTYVGWQRPIYKSRDGSALHGKDYLEIERDDTKPGKVNLNFLGHENVIYSIDAKGENLEACDYVIVGYDFTLSKLKQFMDRGFFDEEQSEKLYKYYKDKQINDYATFKIYKKFCKYQDTVYVAWFCNPGSDGNMCSDWLRPPEKLFFGRRRQEEVFVDVPVTIPDTMTGLPIQTRIKQKQLQWVDIYESLYPIKILFYQETEESEICESKGRAWLDGPKQEAQTCLWSNFVNLSTRASNIYASPSNPQGTGAPRKMELELEPGSIYTEPLEFWSPNMPSMDLIRAAQAMDTQTQVETGRVAFAAINNQDSRKTAREIQAAQQQNQLLNSVQVTLFSIFLCEVWNHVWSILQSLALQGEIPFLMQAQDPVSGKYINDVQKLSLDYKLKPAGDVDVIERAELMQRRQEAFPLVTQLPQMVLNPLAVVFAKDYFEEAFPEDSPEYNGIIDQMVQMAQMAQQQQNQVASLMNILKISAETKQPISPADYKQLEAGMIAQQQQTAAQVQPQQGNKQLQQNNQQAA